MDHTTELRHFGVRGMKWGVRKAQNTPTPRQMVKAEKKLAKEDAGWHKKAEKNIIPAFNKAAGIMNSHEITRINKKYENVDTSDLKSPAGKRYLKEYEDTFKKHYVDALNEAAGSSSPSGKYRLHVEYDVQRDMIPRTTVETNDIKHSEVAFVNPSTNEDLVHFGVRGMKWGVRKSPETRAAAYQKKANDTAAKVRAIGANAKTDSSGNTYMTRGDVGKANRLIGKHQKYSSKAEKYKAISDKAKRTPYSKGREREYSFSYKRAIGTLAVGAASVTIASLIRPTVDIFGKAAASKIKGAMVVPAAKRAARKHFSEDAAEFARRRAAAKVANTAANLAGEKYAPW